MSDFENVDLDRRKIFIDTSVMPAEWNRQQKRAWASWALRHLNKGECKSIISDRGSQVPEGQRYILLGFECEHRPQ